MKKLHRPQFYAWSEFNPERNLDFHSYLWIRPTGNVAIDPLPLSRHDAQHLEDLGGLSHILISNADHVRATAELAAATGAVLWGPEAEKSGFPIHCENWLSDGDRPFPGLEVLALDGSKTPGELAFVLEEQTLVTGDLIRAHEAGRLCLLPAPKLTDPPAAHAAVARLAARPEIVAVLVGDGWPIFRDGQRALQELVASFADAHSG